MPRGRERTAGHGPFALSSARHGEDPSEAKGNLKAMVGELKMKPKKVSETTDPKTNKIKEVWAYEVTGEALIQNILVPLSGKPGCLSDIAGAREDAQRNRAIPFEVEIEVGRAA